MFEDLNYFQIPVDVFEISRRLQIRVIPYSILNKEILEIFQLISPDGFSILNQKEKCYEIYYNEKKLPSRTSFTIMHEIGHIMLNHNEASNETEEEANFFAKLALVPPFLIYYYNLRTPDEIALKFKISKMSAKYIYDDFTKAIQFPKIKY